MNEQQSTIKEQQSTTNLTKLLTFKLGNLYLALPVEYVQKVVNYTTVYSSGLNETGIARVGDREITVIDLHKRLFKNSQVIEAGAKCYFIITKKIEGEEFGILVSQTPTLVDVPLAQIRTLPASYRRSDTLGIASHVTMIPQTEGQLTVFLLDLAQLIPQQRSPVVQ
jgi:purine-binding chemotaxis protein CheW